MKTAVFPAALRKAPKTRNALLLSCASAAMAVAVLMPQRVHAQAFQGTIGSQAGTVTRNITSGTSETIVIGTNRATINWIPNDNAGSGPINFLPNGYTATFEGDPGRTDFMAFNRIVPADPTRPIQLNGNIVSQLRDITGTSTTQGGRVWFYTPGGIVVGSTAVFDVGSLLLTTLDTGFGVGASGFDQEFSQTFSLANGVAGSVVIENGAQINATGPATAAGNYIALLAPKIEQRGNLQVDGSAAYVAAESATLSINQGLFDITVDIGADGATGGIDHSGTTRGISTATPDNRAIYMVAVSKNSAITTLLGGDVGYTTAGGAAVENGEIVLTAGRNVNYDGQRYLNEANSNAANIQIGAGTYRSKITAAANNNINAQASAGNISFLDDIWFRTSYGNVIIGASGGNDLSAAGLTDIFTDSAGDNLAGNITIGASGGSTVHFGDTVDLQALAFGSPNGLTVTGGNIAVIANGGDITADGALNIYTQANGGNPNYDFGPVDAKGGDILLRAENNGTISAGSVTADASAWGQRVDLQGYAAGDGTGGSISFQSESGGLIDINGNLTAHADGYGGEVSSHGDAAGIGTGGTAYGLIQGGDIEISGTANLTANGIGGSVVNPVTAIGTNGGAGHGGGWASTIGGVGFRTNSDTSNLTIGGDLFLSANGSGGHGASGGEGIGGDAGLRSNAGNIGVGGALSFNSRGTGGNASIGYGGTGGFAQGGTNYIQAELSAPGATFASISGLSASMDVGATGGAGGAGNGDNIAAGSGGNARGGTHTGTEGTGGAHIIAENTGGQLAIGTITMNASGQGGAGGIGGNGQVGGNGGTGTGGSISLGSFRRPPFTSTAALAQIAHGTVNADASGTGGDGGAGDNGGPTGIQGNGGAAFGGGHCGVADTCGGIAFGVRGAITMSSAVLTAIATGGAGTVGGNATGGDVGLILRPGGTLITTGPINLEANAVGGLGIVTGGNAQGGNSGVDFNGGGLSTTDLTVRANGTGGQGGVQAGEGRGGTAQMLFGAGGGSLGLSGSTIIAGQGFGGAGINNVGGAGGAGGLGQGGTALLDVASELDVGASVTISSTGSFFDLRASGIGGAGGNGTIGGAGGDGRGGTGSFYLRGSTMTATGSVNLTAAGNAGLGGNGTAGTGGDGGDGFGGTGNLNVNGALTAFNYTNISSGNGAAGGTGSAGAGNGGNGQGGDASAIINGSVTTTSTNPNQGMVITAFGGGGNGAVGGNAQGGDSYIAINGSYTGAYIQSTGSAAGGIGSAGAGGNATGGSGLVEALGTINAGRVSIATFTVGGAGTSAGGNATSGSAMFDIRGPVAVTVTGTDVQATAVGGAASAGAGGNAIGGDATLRLLDSGSLTTGNLNVVVDATGGNGTTAGGDAFHIDGNATIEVGANRSISVTGNATVSANATAGGAAEGEGGLADGGSAYLNLADGSVFSSTGLTAAQANATGGNGGQYGGAGNSGTAQVSIDGGSLTAGSLEVFANAVGGEGQITGGDATAEEARVQLGFEGGSLTVSGYSGILAEALSGDGVTETALGGSAGSAYGGTAAFETSSEMSVDATISLALGNLDISAFASGGDGGTSDTGGAGGNAEGGDARLTLASGTMTAGRIRLLSQGVAGNGGTSDLVGAGGSGGIGDGGTAIATIAGNLTATNMSLQSNGQGGNGGGGPTQGLGGSGTGGTSGMTVSGSAQFTSPVDVEGLVVTSFGGGGHGSTGGSGQGGASALVVDGTLITNQLTQVTARAQGGDGQNAAGGNATGGTATLDVNGTLNAGRVLVATTATGGAGTNSSPGGNAIAGTSTFNIYGDATVGTMTIDASAVGGLSFNGDGGDAESNYASLFVEDSASLTAGGITVSADATGGAGTANGGDASQNVEGGAFIEFGVDATGALSGATTVRSVMRGGAGGSGAGGDADAALASMTVSGGSITGTTDLLVLANSFGGNGASGGAGTGGDASLRAEFGGTIQLARAALVADGTGGSSSGGNGAAGTGGDAIMSAEHTGSSITIANAALTSADNVQGVLASAEGTGGRTTFAGAIGGTGTGGTSTVRADLGANITLATVAGNGNRIYARGRGGAGDAEGATGGEGHGGTVELGVNDGATMTATGLHLSSYGWGGFSTSGTFNSDGGDGFGGIRNVFANSGGTLTLGGTAGTSGGIGGDGWGTGNGGDGSGGSARLDVNGSTVTLADSFNVTGQAGGGAGQTGGNATSGSAIVAVINGGILQSTNAAAQLGVGGNALGGIGVVQGGAASGGTALVSVDATSSINLAGRLFVSANAFGGSGNTGGNGTGGIVNLSSSNALSASTIDLSAAATGGNGINQGGAGVGGGVEAEIFAGGTLNAANLSIGADGFGGSATTGVGGVGDGGSASLAASGDVTVTGEAFISAEGEGGEGGTQGGDGYGGDAGLWADSGAIVDLGTVTNVETEGSGASASNGVGGQGIGGYAHVHAYSGSTIIANDLTVAASGEGGAGTSIGGNGYGGGFNEGPGGAILEASGIGSVLTLTGLTTVESNGESIPPAQAGAGLVRFSTSGGTITADDLLLEANGSIFGGVVRFFSDSYDGIGSGLIDLDSVTAMATGGSYAGDVLFDVGVGSSADLGVATLTSGGALAGQGEDGIEIGVGGTLTADSLQLSTSDGVLIETFASGQLTVAGAFTIDSLDLVRMLDDGSGLVSASTLDLAGSDILLNGAIAANDILLTLPGDYAIGSLPQATGSLTINAGGAISAAENLFYDGGLSLTAGTDMALFDVDVGGGLALHAGGEITTGSISAGGGSINLVSTGGAITTGSLDATLGLFVDGNGNVSIADATAGLLGVEIHSGGDIAIGDVSAITGVELDALGGVAAGSIGSSTHVIVTAGDDLQVAGVTAGNSADFTAGGLASFYGVVSSPTITVTSRDIYIDVEGGLGIQGVTDLLTFNALSDGLDVLIGGLGDEGAEGQYQLGEEGDISADAVVFNAVAATNGGSAPNVRLLDLEIDGSNTDGGGVGSVTLNTAASVFVDGAVSFLGAAATDVLAINAGDSIQVNTDSGSIEMSGANGLSGILELTAHDIWIAEGDVLAELNANPDFAGRDDALGTNNGAVNPGGFVQAGELTVTMLGSSFMVQNTGTDTDPAGLTVGDGGLNIVNEGTEPATVIIYGRQSRSDGTVNTGDAFFEQVEFSGNDSFSEGSNVNGCSVDGGCNPPPTEEPGAVPGPESILGPIGLMSSPEADFGGNDDSGSTDTGDGGSDEGEEAEDEEEESEEENQGSVDASTGLINTGPVSVQQDYDQPVTSGSDGPNN